MSIYMYIYEGTSSTITQFMASHLETFLYSCEAFMHMFECNIFRSMSLYGCSYVLILL